MATARDALLAICIACAAACANAQGLKISAQTFAASKTESTTLASKYFDALDQSKKLAQGYKTMSAATAKAACTAKNSRGRATLCGGGSTSEQDNDAALMMAAAPKKLTWHQGSVGRIPGPLGPVQAQGECSTCVSFAVTAAAEAAVARVLGLPGSQVQLSEQQVGFCPEAMSGAQFCDDPVELNKALSKFNAEGSSIVAKRCLPYTVDKDDSSSSICNYQCKDPDPNAAKGKFSVRSLRDYAAIQRHIRNYGAVVSGMALYKDLRTAMAKNPTGVYDGAQCVAGDPKNLDQYHAVALVGYNNDEGYWVARNSWGPGFADNGYFKIKYGVCGVADSSQTRGIVFEPYSGRRRDGLTADPAKPGCQLYQAKPGDSLAILADEWGVDLGDLIAQNTAILPSLDDMIEGKTLSVCGVAGAPSVLAASVPAPPSAPSGPPLGAASGSNPPPPPASQPTPAPNPQPTPTPNVQPTSTPNPQTTPTPNAQPAPATPTPQTAPPASDSSRGRPCTGFSLPAGSFGVNCGGGGGGGGAGTPGFSIGGGSGSGVGFGTVPLPIGH